MFRLIQLREGTRQALERGSLDQFGRTHEPEQRSVIYVLDALISYFPALELEAKEVTERQSEQEAVANRPLYSNDAMSWGDLTELL